jgi:urocanate hydratase
MGGAQPLAVTLNDGVVLIVDVDESRLARRVEHGYLDEYTTDLDAARARRRRETRRRGAQRRRRRQRRRGLPELLRRRGRRGPIDIVTDQTSAHDPLAYLPIGISVAEWKDAAASDPATFTDRARASMAAHVEAMVGFQDAGAAVFDYGNSIRREAELGGFDRAFAFPGSCPPTSGRCSPRAGPFRWVALSGDPEDIAKTDRAVAELFPDDAALHRWLEKRARPCTSRAFPRASAGSATRSATSPGCASTRWSRRASSRADRDRPRPPRLRLGRLARTARPRRWPTAPTRSPTGRC